MKCSMCKGEATCVHEFKGYRKDYLCNECFEKIYYAGHPEHKCVVCGKAKDVNEMNKTSRGIVCSLECAKKLFGYELIKQANEEN